jgi:hypothetical protein
MVIKYGSGAKETSSNKLRIDMMQIRDSSNLVIFVNNHIEAGTTILTDSWAGYSFLDSYNSVWLHEIYNHGAGNFGIGFHSTLHLEVTWSHLKSQITNIYNIIPKTNYIYFIREAEFRLNICKKSDGEKLNIFKSLLRIVFDLNNYEFFDESEILSFDNYHI